MTLHSSVRRPIAVVVSRFPLLTETFILRELIELERQGQPVLLLPLIRQRAHVTHEEARPWIDRAVYTPYLSLAIVRANLREFVTRPLRYAALLARLTAGSLRSPAMLLKTLAFWPKCVYLSELLARAGITHIHAHFATYPAMAAFIASRLSGTSYSITVHAHDIFVDRTMLGPKVRGAAFVRCISEFNRSFLLDQVSRLDAGRTLVIHTGVPSSASDAIEWPMNSSEPVILCVAALKPYKGIQVLLDACRILRDRHVSFRCHILGDGPLRTDLEEYVRRVGLTDSVAFHGAQPQHAVAMAMRDATLFVHPSIVARTGQMDGIPVALMEAMAAGCPVIASDLSGIPELIGNGLSGILVPPGDATALANAMSRLLADGRLATEFGSAGREAVRRRFDLRENVQRLITEIDRFNPTVEIDTGLEVILTGLGKGQMGIRGVRRRPDSELTELIHSDGVRVRELVLKRHAGHHHDGRGPVERAGHEFRVLSQLASVRAHSRTAWNGFGAPRPVAYRAADAAILMTRCSGEPLDLLIRRARTGDPDAAAQATEALRRAGRWLRLFQETDRFGGHDAVAHLFDRAAADLELCIERRMLPGRARAALRGLEALASMMSTSARQVVAKHGDFWPGNILVGDSLSVVDFEAVEPGLPYQDIAYFLIHLQLYFQRPGLGHQFNHFAHGFLEGFAGGEGIDRAAIQLGRVAAALQALAHASSERSLPRSVVRQRCFRSIVLRASGVPPTFDCAWQVARGEAQ